LQTGVLVLLLLSTVSTRADEIIERVLAVVGGEVITLADVNAARAFGLVPPSSASDPIGETLNRLIDRALMLAEVDRYVPPEPSTEAIDRSIQRIRARFASQEAFDAALARVGLDDRYLRERTRQDLRIESYIEQRFTVQAPTDGEPATVAERRQALVDTWLAGLRRRAEITNLYLTSK